jgi:formylglycine-generating enzyme required for sulfatase activity
VLVFACGLAAAAFAQPTVSNVTASQTAGARTVAISYALAHPQGLACRVTVQASRDNGATWETVASVSGAVGAGIAPGTGKGVTWNAGTDWPAQLFPQVKVRITADDGQTGGGGPAPAGMVLIPAGMFTMGNGLSSTNDGNSDELPTHAVTLSAFFLAKTETTKADWDEVRLWAVTRGYTDLATGGGKASTHPVQGVTWYDVVKWCNAKSEKDGLTPVYYSNDGQTAVYRTGSVDVTLQQVNWMANGYRLPTEAEWEYAARGGTSGKRFPWGDTVAHTQTNYFSSTSLSYDVSPTRGYHPSYATGSPPYTSPGGSFAANGYGLTDMSGNVWEWNWDRYGSYSSAAQTNPRGPASGFNRAVRGGGWGSADGLRCSARNAATPFYRSFDVGFRSARNSVP